MDDFTGTLSASAFSAVVLEGLKRLVRLLIKQPEYDFPTWSYILAIPVLNYFIMIFFAWLGIAGYTYSFDGVVPFVKSVIIIVVQALITLGTYATTIKPLKTYSVQLRGKG